MKNTTLTYLLRPYDAWNCKPFQYAAFDSNNGTIEISSFNIATDISKIHRWIPQIKRPGTLDEYFAALAASTISQPFMILRDGKAVAAITLKRYREFNLDAGIRSKRSTYEIEIIAHNKTVLDLSLAGTVLNKFLHFVYSFPKVCSLRAIVPVTGTSLIRLYKYAGFVKHHIAGGFIMLNWHIPSQTNI